MVAGDIQGQDLEIRVRRAAGSDAGGMALLFHETVHAVNAADYSPAQLRAWSPRSRSADDWQRRQAGMHVWVAEVAGELAGFAELETDGGIDCFFVSHRHQRQGVGGRLMTVLLASARRLGMGIIHADVSITALGFFRAQGFVVESPVTATRHGVAFRQYRMARRLNQPESADRGAGRENRL